jgi:hypothetical protein
VAVSRSHEAPYDDSPEYRYANLDDDERAEALAYESGPRASAGGRWLLDEVPMQPGTVLTCRSIWTGAAVVVLAFFVFGAIVQHIAGIAVVGVVLAMGLVAHGRGPARRVEVRGVGDVIIQGGFWGRTVRLAEFDWAATYKSAAGPIAAGRSSTVVLHRDEGRHALAKIVGVWFPTVSRRRTTVVLSSLWRYAATGQRVPDNTMAEFFRMACRDSGMRVMRGRGRRVWTAGRTRPVS